MLETVTKKRMVSLGLCILGGKKEGRLFREFDSEGNLGEEWAMGRSVLKHMGGPPGMMYEVESVREGSIRPGSAVFLGLWKDQEQRAEWQAVHKARKAEFDLIRMVRRAKKDDAVLECLEPLRRAYRQTRGLQRQLLLARVVDYIVR